MCECVCECECECECVCVCVSHYRVLHRRLTAAHCRPSPMPSHTPHPQHTPHTPLCQTHTQTHTHRQTYGPRRPACLTDTAHRGRLIGPSGKKTPGARQGGGTRAAVCTNRYDTHTPTHTLHGCTNRYDTHTYTYTHIQCCCMYKQVYETHTACLCVHSISALVACTYAVLICPYVCSCVGACEHVHEEAV